MKDTIGILVMLMTVLNSCNTYAQDRMTQINKVQTFVFGFENYKMDIQAAGIASIPVATLADEKTLYIEYTYKADGENRNGKMTLSRTKNHNRFEGSWKTIADNGNSYEGSLYFIFEDDGQATGFYNFFGTDYKIAIFKE